MLPPRPGMGGRKGRFRGVHGWKRIVVAARHFGTSFDGKAPETLQAVGTRAAIMNGLWATLASVDIRTALGVPPEFPAKDFAKVMDRVASRV